MTFDPGIQTPVEEVLMVAEAALEAHRWEDARRLSEKAIDDFPQEARSYFEYARKVVLIAERQRLCMDLKAISNAPGEVVPQPGYLYPF
jgi:hypothetical protein